MKTIALCVSLLLASTASASPPPSLGWNLRPVAPGNVIRSDTTVGRFTDAGVSGTTVASTFLVSYKLTPVLAPLVRVAVVHHDGSAISNPLVGVTWAPRIVAPPFKVSVFGALALPLGSGGGDDPNPRALATIRAAVAVRSGMDNALFAVNDLTPIAGVDAAYVANGLTLQLEATVFELIRVRGAMAQPDAYKTNFTTGFHAGYFVLPWLSASAELRYQRFLSSPAFVQMDATGASRDALSAAVGLRGNVHLGEATWLRPGLSYARGLDDPLAGRSYQVIQIDVPFVF